MHYRLSKAVSFVSSFVPAMGSNSAPRVAFAGLGAMGLGMATHLLKRGYAVTGYDVYEPSVNKFKSVGGRVSLSPRDAASGSSCFICMVANSQQVDAVLFDAEAGAVQGMHCAEPYEMSL